MLLSLHKKVLIFMQITRMFMHKKTLIFMQITHGYVQSQKQETSLIYMCKFGIILGVEVLLLGKLYQVGF